MPRRSRETERRSAAARAGWERRRERERQEQERRSDAARRGWETRRERERETLRDRARRSDAAQRGWETRREREREAREPWELPDTAEFIVEEPIEQVGGKKYKRKGGK